MDWRIRPVAVTDIRQIEVLYAEFLDESLAEPSVAKRNPELDCALALERLMCREPSAMLVAETEDALAGFAFVELRRGTEAPRGWWGRLSDAVTRRRASLPALMSACGWLAHLYVRPIHRRRGLAEALVRAAAEWARQRGARSLDLNVLAANAPARKLYRKLAMTETLVEYRLPL